MERWTRKPDGRQCHVLKTLQPFFEEIVEGRKRFEIRRDDRYYAVGDYLRLLEWKDGSPTGREFTVTVTFRLGGREGVEYGLQEGYAILSISPVIAALSHCLGAVLRELPQGSTPWRATGDRQRMLTADAYRLGMVERHDPPDYVPNPERPPQQWDCLWALNKLGRQAAADPAPRG